MVGTNRTGWGAAVTACIACAGWLVVERAIDAQQQQQPPPQTPAFRAGVDVVSLNVTVTDRDQRFVTDLEQGDFVVFEDGVQQEVAFFTRTQLPIALALLIDTSASMDERMSTAQEAAIGFSQRLRPEDLAEIIDFDSRADVLQDFTNDVEKLEDAIRRTSAGGSTSLYNALYVSLKDLTKAPLREADVRREAIIVLSDGEDTSSLVSFEEVLELAKRSETAIYSIGLKADDGRSRTGFREADFVLRQLAQETGGKRSSPTGSASSTTSTSRSPRSSRASTRLVTSRPTRCATVSGDASSSARIAKTSAPGPSQGYYGPTR